eukprot:8265720-Alexandrium_andersonii.AAC.1
MQAGHAVAPAAMDVPQRSHGPVTPPKETARARSSRTLATGTQAHTIGTSASVPSAAPPGPLQAYGR